MTQPGTLQTLKALAEKEVDSAASALGEIRIGCQRAEAQLTMLINYQLEYQSSLNGDLTQGIASPRWQNYQQFIQTLENAIAQHRQQVVQWQQRVEQALTAWREKKKRLQMWQTLHARQTAAAALADSRVDQKQMDEFARRSATRKPQ